MSCIRSLSAILSCSVVHRNDRCTLKRESLTSVCPTGNAAKRAKASASSGQQEQQPPVGSARHVSGSTAMDDSEVADDLMAEINDLGGSFRLSAVSRRLYESASGASLPSQPNQGRSIQGGLDGHQENSYAGGYSETQTQLSQDMEDALAESLAEEAAAAAEAASAWLLPARSSIDFPGDVMSVTAQSDERVYCQVRDPSQVRAPLTQSYISPVTDTYM